MAQFTLRRSYKSSPPPAYADEGIDFTTLAFFYRDDTDMVALDQRNYVEREAVPWQPRPFLDEGVDSTQLAYFQTEENDLVAPDQRCPVQRVPWNPVPFLDRDGIDSTQLAYYYSDDTDISPLPHRNYVQREAVPWAGLVALDTDEVVQATVVVQDDDDGYVFAPVPPVQTTWRNTWAQLDENEYPFTVEEEDGFLTQPVQAVWRNTWVQLDESELAGFAYFYLEQEEFFLPSVTALPRPTPAALDDEIAPTTFDQEEGPPYLPQQKVYTSCFVQLDENEYPFTFDQEEGSPFLPQQARPWLPVVFADEHAGSPLTYFFLIDDDWFPPSVTALPRPTPAATDEDPWPAPPVNLFDDEAATPTPVTTVPWRTPRLFPDEAVDATTLTYFYLDDEAAPPPYPPRPAAQPPRSAATDDEAFAVAFDQEEGANTSSSGVAWACGRPAMTDDEAFSFVIAEEDGPAMSPARLLARAPFALPADDDFPTPPPPFGLEEERTAIWAGAVTYRIWSTFVFLDEDGLFLGKANPNEGRILTQGPRVAVARLIDRRPIVKQVPRGG